MTYSINFDGPVIVIWLFLSEHIIRAIFLRPNAARFSKGFHAPFEWGGPPSRPFVM